MIFLRERNGYDQHNRGIPTKRVSSGYIHLHFVAHIAMCSCGHSSQYETLLDE